MHARPENENPDGRPLAGEAAAAQLAAAEAPPKEETTWPKPKMTGWYDVGQLAQTGLRTFLSTMLGGMVDTRRFLALEDPAHGVTVDYSKRDSFSFDYTGDTGDGWDATYSMAYLLSSPQLDVGGHLLNRPDVLILGGDEVYPVASRNNYARHLIWPFNEAARKLGQVYPTKPLSDLFCVPGNHDWYDCLNAFQRRFCNHRRVGSFQTRQQRSYFALKLPNHWHIWSIDIQLSAEVDPAQRRYFSTLAKDLTAVDRIILCVAEPPIVNGKTDRDNDLTFGLGLFHKLAEKKDARVLAVLAGDTHNYQRYVVTRVPKTDPGEAKKQPYQQWNIVSGGGGAFLHPTHAFPAPAHKENEQAVKCDMVYPGESDSRRLSHKLFAFPFSNRSFAALLGAVHVFAFWGVEPGASWVNMPFTHPGPTVWLLLLIGGLAWLGYSSGKFAIGLIHGLLQGWLACTAWRWSQALTDSASLSVLVQWAVSSLTGGVLFGSYLWVSLNWFRCHHNEAFSAIQVADYKSFLRIQVQPDKLTVHVVGVDKIAGAECSHPVKVHMVEQFDIS